MMIRSLLQIRRGNTLIRKLFHQNSPEHKTSSCTSANKMALPTPVGWNQGPGPLRVTCGELRACHAGQTVELVGRVHQQRMGRFILLRDGHGAVQLVVPEERLDISKRFVNMPMQSYISIIGNVIKRPLGALNEKMATGAVEVLVQEFVMVQVKRSCSIITKNIASSRQYSTNSSSKFPLTSEEYSKYDGTTIGHQLESRTDTCGSLCSGDTGRTVTLLGWVKQLRLPRFMVLKDGYGIIQCLLPNSKLELLEVASTLTQKSTIEIQGKMSSRPDSQINMDTTGGNIEIILDKISILDPTAMESLSSTTSVATYSLSQQTEQNCEPLQPSIKNCTPIKENDQNSSPLHESEQNSTDLQHNIKKTTPLPPKDECSQKHKVVLQEGSEVNSHCWRSHSCGELRLQHAGQHVTLCGWLQHRRMGRFLTLRDSYGVTQAVIPQKICSLLNLDDISLESVLKITGIVTARPVDSVNKSMATGDIELCVEHLEVLNSATHAPFSIRAFQKPRESLRLQHRYIDIRRPEMQHNLRLRSSMIMNMRKFLIDKHNFVEVETPTLFCRTPGGAKEFIVPTRHKGEFYSLVQSPQQFKQMLMAGAIDRYFQVARCYRDEMTRGDRQPEFTQLDIEMSFASREDILSLMEDLLRAAWPRELPDGPFPRLTYNYVMKTYGSDKPDTSFQFNLSNITCQMRDNFTDPPPEDFGSFAIIVRPSDGNYSNKYIKSLPQLVKEKYPDIKVIPLHVKDSLEQWLNTNLQVMSKPVMRSLATALHLSGGEYVIVAYGNEEDSCLCLGEIRQKLAEKLHERAAGLESPLWVVDFPLFVRGDEGQIETCHHPFTAPHPDDLDMLQTEPFKVRSLAYDLVLNGSEVGGGSVRAHEGQMQRRLLDLLNLPAAPLQHLLAALDSGCPPHAGIALGIDRLVTIASKAESIREVIAFPKSHEGRDPLSGAPSSLTPEEQKLYHIQVV